MSGTAIADDRTLHVAVGPVAGSTQGVGGFVSLLIRAAAGDRDAVLAVGCAHVARDLAAVLGRSISHTPTPRLGTGATIPRLIERVARASGAGSVRIWSGPGAGEPDADEPIDFSALPEPACARRALGLGSDPERGQGRGDATTIVPLTDRPDLVDARTLMFLTGVVELIGERLELVLPAQARRLGEAMSYHRGAGLRTPVRLVDRSWLCALPAADVFVEPIDAGDGFPARAGRALAAHLGVEVAVTEAWHLDPDTATNSLPAEIRATVGPVLARARAVRSKGAAIA